MPHSRAVRRAGREALPMSAPNKATFFKMCTRCCRRSSVSRTFQRGWPTGVMTANVAARTRGATRACRSTAVTTAEAAMTSPASLASRAACGKPASRMSWTRRTPGSIINSAPLVAKIAAIPIRAAASPNRSVATETWLDDIPGAHVNGLPRHLTAFRGAEECDH